MTRIYTSRLSNLIFRHRALSALLLLILVFICWKSLSAHRPETASERARMRVHTPQDMVLVPGGEFWMGTNDADADDEVRPMHQEFVPAFYIDVHEVTNREFHKFDPSHAFLPGDDNLPVSGVTYDEAAAYAKWAGKRLPTEQEWEKAARGTDGRRYPWGDTWDMKRVAPRRRRPNDPVKEPVIAGKVKICSIGPSRLQPVGSVASGVSPYGCYDMAGNAWEWVQGFYNGNRQQRILRGGAVGYGERACRTYTQSVEGAADT